MVVEGPKLVFTKNASVIGVCDRHMKIIKQVINSDIITKYSSKLVYGFRWDEVPRGMKIVRARRS